MTEFNEGDKVRVVSEHTLNGVGYSEVEVGDIVTVERAMGMWDVPTYRVRRADGGISVIDATCLELGYTFDPGGEKISFEDVRKGDTIAHLGEDSWNVGVADRFIDDAWWTKIGNMVTCGDVDYDRRLLHRPEPKVDPAKVAAVTAALSNAGADHWDGLTNLAEALVKAGVSVDV